MRDVRQAALLELEAKHAAEAEQLHAAVRAAEDDRLRAIRLAMALGKDVPPALRAALDKEVERQRLERVLDRPSQPPRPGKVPSVPDALSALERARRARAEHAATAALEIGAAKISLARAEDAVREAEADHLRLA